MKKYTFLLFFFNIIIHLNLFAQDVFETRIVDKRGVTREHYVNFEKLSLALDFLPKQGKIYGTADYIFEPLSENLSSLYLDAPNMEITSVKLNNEVQNFKMVAGGINIAFRTPLKWFEKYNLVIEYETTPSKGMYFIGWNDETNRSRKQIWTQGQGVDNRYWIPSYDGVNDKLVTETFISFETGYEVISNGILKSKTINKNNTTTWHYAMKNPHSLYLMMVAIGKYDAKKYKTKSGKTILQYYYPDQVGKEKITYKHTNRMMDWFENELKVPFPWGVYKNIPVKNFMYGAMENTSATIFTDYFLQNEREALEKNYISVNAHELAHQWFGDYITEWDGSSHWLHESFATYYSKHFQKSILGEEHYKWLCREEQNIALKASIKNNYPLNYTDAGASRHYYKGSFVLDMLKDVVGEVEYNRAVTAFLKRNAYENVGSYDFQISFMKTLGKNLDWFFDQWIYKGGEPFYDVSYKSENRKTIFNVKQIQKKNKLVGIFKMPITFQVHYKDASYDEISSFVEKDRQTVIVPNKNMKEIDYVLFDPNSKILKKVRFKKSFEELMSQAKKAEHMIDRYDAVIALKDQKISKKRNDFIDIYLDEDFKAIKQNILLQLKDDDNTKTSQLFVYAIADNDVAVRRTAIKNINMDSKRYIIFYEEMLEDSSYANIELALEKLCTAFPNMKTEYLNRTKNVKNENNSLKLTWLKLNFGDQKQLFGEFVDFASQSYDFRVNIKAIKILGAIYYYDNLYMKYLVNAYLSYNWRLSSPAEKQLSTFIENEQVGITVVNYLKNDKWNDFQRKKIEKLLARSGK